MFVPKNVMERVINRLKVLRSVREEQIHEAYVREMCEELLPARRAAMKLANTLSPMAKHPEKGWVMLQRHDVKKVIDSLEEWLSATK
jgi:hypothetical protein